MEKTNNKAQLIRDFFGMSGSDAIREIKALTADDRQQLASAIARDRGLTEANCDFDFVAY